MKKGSPKSSSVIESSGSREEDLCVNVNKKGSGNIVIPFLQDYSSLVAINCRFRQQE